MFKFKGISSNEMGVICEEEDNTFIGKASQRYEQIDIEGKNGAIFNPLGYSNIEKNMKLYVRDITKIDKILSWLDGEGILEYKNRITKAYFFSSVEPQRSSAIKTIELPFIRESFWYEKNDYFITVNDNVYNNGNKEVHPIIRLEKNTSDSIELSINDVRFIYNFDEDTIVEIDCEKMNATHEGILKNRNLEIDFDFPILNPGNNKVVVHSGDAIIKIKRKDCWL